MKPIKIVSGGQTGADRAALDWALAHNVPCGGWCPKGRKSEDGPIDPKYLLKETPLAAYLQRTEWNVRDSDATVLFSIAPVFAARTHGKTLYCPLLLERTNGCFRLDVEPFTWMLTLFIAVINCHGPLPAARNFPALLQGLARTNC
jgi:hypothetical protein